MASHLEEIACPLCGARDAARIGIRGNREYHGADPRADPHVWTYVVRCRRCDFIYTNPMIRGLEHLEKAHYADPIEYRASPDGGQGQMFRRRLDFIERFQKPGALLDVGAGKGEFLAEARSRGWSVAGVEPTAPFCRYAQQTFGLELQHGTLEQAATLVHGSFDVVTLNHVLEHVERPAALLRLCALYVRPGGTLFVEVPNTDSDLLRAADAYFRVKGLRWSSRLSPLHPPFHCFGYTKRSLRHALAESGWIPRSVETFSGRDRGCRGSGEGSPAALLRDAASRLLDYRGNRELLAVVAVRSADAG